MNTKTTAVTGESKASRVFPSVLQSAEDDRRTAWPTFEDIQMMAGFPVDNEGFAVVLDEEQASSDEDYGNNIVGEPADENSDDRAWNEVEHDRDESVGDGETDAERNA